MSEVPMYLSRTDYMTHAVRLRPVQGYLAHKKHPLPSTLQKDRPWVADGVQQLDDETRESRLRVHTGAPRLPGKPPPWAPTVGCLGFQGGPGGVSVVPWARYPCTATIQVTAGHGQTSSGRVFLRNTI